MVPGNRDVWGRMVSVEFLGIEGLALIVPERHGDHRGFFSEVYNRADLAAKGISLEFVQDNHSLSADKGTLRGLHFQAPPFAQAKLVRVSRGAVLDVAVDIRKGSPSYGRHVAVTLSANAWNQLLVPVGFAHGFLTLEPGTEVQYKVTAPYSRECDAGIAWDDPELGIDWGLPHEAIITSQKDRNHARLSQIISPFDYDFR